MRTWGSQVAHLHFHHVLLAKARHKPAQIQGEGKELQRVRTQEGVKDVAILMLYHQPHDMIQVIQKHMLLRILWVEQNNSG